ncbi:hypothetical protein niasHS_014225 [Heterodera schachtii]|uniref:Lon proteolytic domain-containing protein n=1 Tax=Heterodera schachtii TaxID=97005 RepID=A0ABD2IAC5_HETSC
MTEKHQEMAPKCATNVAARSCACCEHVTVRKIRLDDEGEKKSNFAKFNVLAPGDDGIVYKEPMIGVVVGLSRSGTVTEETKGGGLMDANNDRRRRRARQSFNRLGDNRIHSFQKVDAQNGRQLPGESPTPHQRSFNGGYGKSGPSGALTEAIAFISIARGDKPRAKCAITGQLTIKGFVLKVSSIAEKTQSAMKGKFTTMVMPAGNKSDFDALPEEGRSGITPKFVMILTVCPLFKNKEYNKIF